MKAVNMLRALVAGLLLLVAALPGWAVEVSCSGVYADDSAAWSACESKRVAIGGSTCGVWSVSSVMQYCPGFTGEARRTYVGTSYHLFIHGGGCPGGQTPTGPGGLCEVASPPGPDCAEMQTYIDGVCTPDTPEPAPAAGEDIGVTVCEPPTDCSVQANWTPWSDAVNIGGWTYGASSPSECFGSTTVVCNTNAVYQAGGPASTGTVVGGSSIVGGTNAVTVSCPDGGVVVNNFCEYPAVAGTPTTSTTPGTAGTPATYSCPVGYASDGIGGCISASGTSNYVCPSGYTKQADGSCTGAAGSIPGVFGPDAGTGPNAVGSCGGLGQPACSVNVNYDQSIPSAEALLTGDGGVSTITAVEVGGPAAVCPAPMQLPHGIVVSWSTVCDFASFLRPIILALAWLSAGVLVLGGKGI